ncbi:MYG1 exonuclease [Linum perenne]
MTMFALGFRFRYLVHFTATTITSRFTTTRRLCAFSATAPRKRVGTHNGTFHCDEALACFMIRLTHNFSDAEIVRTRDPKLLETLDAVVDVGGVYDPGADRYDHHQKGFDQVFGNGFSTKLSSAGLVYKHYGEKILAKEVQLVPQSDLHMLYLAIYKNFVEAVDAVDNGTNQYDSDRHPRYVNNTTLSSRVAKLNLDWTESDQSPEKENEAFRRAMELAGSEFLESVRFHAKSWLPARSILKECLTSRKHVDASGEIIVINRSFPWKLHIFDLEEELSLIPSIKYVLYKDDRSENWRIQAVAVSSANFKSRKPLPVEWRGLENDQLSDVSGIPGCVFVHASGFIGGNRNYEGALAMARASLRAC